MPAFGVNVTTNELLQGGAGQFASTGTLFIAGLADEGPTPSLGVPYVLCRSINDYVQVFGPRSSTSALLYDSLDAFFHEGGSVAYVIRVTDSTATTAALTLNDAVPHPSVVVSALTPGVDGNASSIVVSTSTAATFTANTTNASTAVSNVSSFTNIGVGTLVTGAGIPAGTYVASVNAGASTLVLSQAATATATGVTVTPGTFTVKVQDSSGNVLETHGPFANTAGLYADTSSIYVTFAQSAGSGFTANSPVALTATALTGGSNASDLTDASHVAALAGFPPSLGPGQVVLPGKTSSTATTGLAAHAAANNRVAPIDLTDTPVAAALIAQISALNGATNADYCIPSTAQAIIPGITPGTTRIVPASVIVAALCAQVAVTGNDNQAPAGSDWALNYVTGFTNVYSLADTQALNNVGVNTFATQRSGLGLPGLCLEGFSSAKPSSVDPIFWQASASRERMALVFEGAQVLAKYMFKSLDGQNLTISAAEGELRGLIATHWKNGALYGQNATDAGAVLVAPPINTPVTEQAGQLNANVQVRISPFAQAISLSITSVPITQSV